MDKKKKIIITSIISIFIILIILLTFLFFSSPLENGDDEGVPAWRQFFTFDRDVSTETDVDGNTNLIRDIDPAIDPLIQIHNEPVSGFTLIENEEGNKKIRFMERSTGHIFDYTIQNNSKIKISNTTIPKVYEAIWPNENSIIITIINENTDQVERVFIQLTETTTNEDGVPSIDINGTPLPMNISSIVKSENGNIIYKTTSNDNTSILTSNINNILMGNEIFKSPFRDWTIFPDKENHVTLLTKPSGTIGGSVYSLNINNGNMENLLIEEITGLTVLPNKRGDLMLYSTGGNSVSKTSILNRENRRITELEVNTIPEKCVWSNGEEYLYCSVPKEIPRGIYPDDWYKGLISFSDRIIRIDAITGLTTQIIDPQVRIGIEMDIIKMKNKENLIPFIDKKTLTLWLLNLDNL